MSRKREAQDEAEKIIREAEAPRSRIRPDYPKGYLEEADEILAQQAEQPEAEKGSWLGIEPEFYMYTSVPKPDTQRQRKLILAGWRECKGDEVRIGFEQEKGFIYFRLNLLVRKHNLQKRAERVRKLNSPAHGSRQPQKMF